VIPRPFLLLARGETLQFPKYALRAIHA
jgi:hypothetical protein